MSDTRKVVTEFMQRLQDIHFKLVKGADDLQNALVDKYSELERPSGSNLNDVHPDFFKYITSLAYAMKSIETPDLTMKVVAEKYAGKMEYIVEKMQSGDTDSGALDVFPLSFEYGFLEKRGDDKLKWEINGFGLLNAKNLLSVSSNKHTAYTKMIFYLLRFIALLDLTGGINGGDIITFLKKEDSVTFAPLVTKIASDILSNKYKTKSFEAGTKREIIIEGIERGLSYVATAIINEFRKLSQSTSQYEKNLKDVINKFDTDFVPATSDKYMKELHVTANVFTELQKIKSVPLDDADVKQLFGDEKRAHDRYKNGILNILHLNVGKENGTPGELLFSGYLSGDGTPGMSLADWEKLAMSSDAWNNVLGALAISGTAISGNYTTDVGAGGGEAAFLIEWAKPTDKVKFVLKPSGAPVSATNYYPNASFLYTPPVVEAGVTKDKCYRLTEKLTTTGGKDVTIVDTTVVKMAVDVINRLDQIPKTNFDALAGRIAILGILVSALENNIDLSTGVQIPTVDATKIKISMLDNIKGFDRIKNRLGYIIEYIRDTNKMFSATPAFSQQFVEGFTLGIKRIQFDTKGVASYSIKGRTPLSEWKDLYNFISSSDNINFFNDIFNLVEIDPTTRKMIIPQPNIPLERALKDPNAWNKYSLNVKKKNPEQFGSLQQLGGNGGRNDPNFFELIPLVNPLKINNIWIDMNKFIPHSLIESDAFFRDKIARAIYHTTIISPNQPVPIIDGKMKIVPWDIFKSFAVGNFPIKVSRTYDPLKYYSIGPQAVAGWENVDMKLADDISKLSVRWEREGATWYYRDSDRKDVERPDPEKLDCAFLNPGRCRNFILCINSEGDSKECLKFLKDPTYIATIPESNTEIINQVKTMHPMAAASFLSKIGFRIERTEVPLARDGSGKKMMRRDVVESVTKWMDNLPNLKDVCGNDHLPIQKQLADNSKFSKNKNLFRYLQILVEWVNANSQVLNEEETLYTKDKPVARKPDESFMIYDFVPSEQKRKVTSLCDGLYRMKANLENDLSGWNAETLLSDIYKTPTLSMPLNRSVIVSSNPMIMRQTYGGGTSFENGLKNYPEMIGSRIFSDWYDEIKNIMNSMGQDKYRIRIKEDTEKKINGKLDAFKEAEKQIIILMKEVINRRNLFRASNGRLDTGQIERGDYDTERKDRAIGLEKHANLASLISSYQKRAINLTDVIKTIAETVAEKLGAMSDNKPTSQPTSQSSKSFTERIRRY